MDYSTMEDRVAEYLDRTDLDTQIANWINDTRKDIALKYDFDYLYVEATISTSAGSSTYALPEDYLGHLTIFAGNRKLSRVGGREFDELKTLEEDDDPVSNIDLRLYSATTESSGSPEYYIDRGMNIEFFPTPDSAYVVTMKYYAQPSDFSGATDEDYMSRFHFEAVIFGASLRGAVFLDDTQKIEIFTNAYQQSIAEMIRREKEKYGRDTHVRMKSWKDYGLLTFKRLMRIENS